MPKVDPIMQTRPGQVIFDKRGRVIGQVFYVLELPWDRVTLGRWKRRCVL